jgi:hypothetical protein
MHTKAPREFLPSINQTYCSSLFDNPCFTAFNNLAMKGNKIANFGLENEPRLMSEMELHTQSMQSQHESVLEKIPNTMKTK